MGVLPEFLDQQMFVFATVCNAVEVAASFSDRGSWMNWTSFYSSLCEVLQIYIDLRISREVTRTVFIKADQIKITSCTLLRHYRHKHKSQGGWTEHNLLWCFNLSCHTEEWPKEKSLHFLSSSPNPIYFPEAFCWLQAESRKDSVRKTVANSPKGFLDTHRHLSHTTRTPASVSQWADNSRRGDTDQTVDLAELIFCFDSI